jgi:hypothetical protein
MAPRLVKTSVQLPPNTYDILGAWPGLTRSEAIRISVERATYFSSANSEEITDLALKYAPILSGALEDFGYRDFRIVARALPAIVEGYIVEHQGGDWRNPYDHHLELDWRELLAELKKLDVFGRIGVLDCVVAARNRTERQENKGPQETGSLVEQA